MPVDARNLLSKLIVISKVDSSLARINAEYKQLETELSDRYIALKKLREDAKLKEDEFNDKQTKYQREEKRLKDEQQKLIDRRKALGTFNNYKLQQAAEREIEAASKQLSTQEEALIGMLEGVEELEKGSDESNTALKAQESEFEAFETDAKGTMETLVGRRDEKQAERDALAEELGPRQLSTYNKVHVRFPTDPVVLLRVEDTTCEGCFMNVGPQFVVRVGRGDELVTCRGCGRILYLAEQAGENPDAGASETSD